MIFNSHHLSYCTNVHNYQNLNELISVLNNQVAAVAKNFSKPFSVGLHLNATCVNELYENPLKLQLLRDTLTKNSLYVCSLNCFPYGNFHQNQVKAAVYTPSWDEESRLNYTCKAAKILCELLPENTYGSISTVPIAYGKILPKNALNNLQKMANVLQSLPKKIVLALEPEPDCYLDNSQSVLDFFSLIQQNFSQDSAKFIGLCFDTCHFSVLFENLNETFLQFSKKNIPIYKIQISSALKANCIEELIPYNEPRYLHQTTVKKQQKILSFTDIPQAIEASVKGEYRCHFHIPIYLEKTIHNLNTTQSELFSFFTLLKNLKSSHIEVETYSLNQIPNCAITAVDSSIKELLFLIKHLTP